jgi:hypothetical protein
LRSERRRIIAPSPSLLLCSVIEKSAIVAEKNANAGAFLRKPDHRLKKVYRNLPSAIADSIPGECQNLDDPPPIDTFVMDIEQSVFKIGSIHCPPRILDGISGHITRTLNLSIEYRDFYLQIGVKSIISLLITGISDYF